INLLVPIPAIVFIVPVSLGIIGLQVFGGYRLIEKVFKWLALALLAYTDAAQALRPLAGDAAVLLFAIGLIGSGVLAVPVLTGSAAYGVTEAFGWRSG